MNDFKPEYRVTERDGGFQPEIKCLVRDRERWFALLPTGYWADPDGWNADDTFVRVILPTREMADAAILRAKTINEENRLKAV